jgi:glycosyltransferase involved in cell wall biosynthesis
MKTIKISVIIPVFNAEKFLERAVNSAVFQEEVNELVLVDDGSSDRSVDLIQKLAAQHEKISFYKHPNNLNKGPAATRNLGINHSKNEWIAFLDADDFYVENRFKKDVDMLTSNESLDGVYNLSGVKRIVQDKGIETIQNETRIVGLVNNIEPKNLFFMITPTGSSGRFDTNSILVRKSKIVEAGLFDENMRIGEDVFLFLKLSIIAKLVNSMHGLPLAFRTIHQQNITKDFKEEVDSYLIQVFEKLLVWEHSSFEVKHKLLVLNKYIYYKSKKSKVSLIQELGKVCFKFPRFILSSYFVNYVKHLIKF